MIVPEIWSWTSTESTPLPKCWSTLAGLYSKSSQQDVIWMLVPTLTGGCSTGPSSVGFINTGSAGAFCAAIEKSPSGGCGRAGGGGSRDNAGGVSVIYGRWDSVSTALQRSGRTSAGS